MALQSAVQSIGGQQQYGMSAYQQPMPQPTSYGGIGFGLSGVDPMGLSSQNGMSMMGMPMGDMAQPRGMGAGLQGSFGSPQFVLFVFFFRSQTCGSPLLLLVTLNSYNGANLMIRLGYRFLLPLFSDWMTYKLIPVSTFPNHVTPSI